MPMAVKKRKSTVDPLPCSPMKIMTKDPKPDSGRRVDVARTNLTNALLGLSDSKSNVSPAKDENEAGDAEMPDSGTKELLQKTEPALLRRKKKVKVDEKQAFVMKLFDRSVDLALFDESTPLYPICRAWMDNLPKKTNGDLDKPSDDKSSDKKSGAQKMEVDEEEDGLDVEGIIKSIVNQEDVSLSKLPPPIPLTNPNDRVPSPLHYEKSSLDSILNSDTDSDNAPTKEALLQEHLTNWVATRKKWHDAERRNEDRYKDSRDILEAIYNKAQKHFQ